MTQEDWDKPRIKAEIERRGLTLNQLSTIHGFKRNAAARALRRPYPRFEKIIAAAIGVRPSILWPERYDAHGKSIVRRGRPRKATRDE